MDGIDIVTWVVLTHFMLRWKLVGFRRAVAVDGFVEDVNEELAFPECERNYGMIGRFVREFPTALNLRNIPDELDEDFALGVCRQLKLAPPLLERCREMTGAAVFRSMFRLPTDTLRRAFVRGSVDPLTGESVMVFPLGVTRELCGRPIDCLQPAMDEGVKIAKVQLTRTPWLGKDVARFHEVYGKTVKFCIGLNGLDPKPFFTEAVACAGDVDSVSGGGAASADSVSGGGSSEADEVSGVAEVA